MSEFQWLELLMNAVSIVIKFWPFGGNNGHKRRRKRKRPFRPKGK